MAPPTLLLAPPTLLLAPPTYLSSTPTPLLAPPTYLSNTPTPLLAPPTLLLAPRPDPPTLRPAMRNLLLTPPTVQDISAAWMEGASARLRRTRLNCAG
ncbi:unnamed protein product [Lampetra fluviatilis]